MWYMIYDIYIYAIKWTLDIFNNMDVFRVYYAKWDKSEMDKYCVISLVLGI